MFGVRSQFHVGIDAAFKRAANELTVIVGDTRRVPDTINCFASAFVIALVRISLRARMTEGVTRTRVKR